MSPFTAPGTIHGGVDFQFADLSQNVEGVHSVYFPVSGTLEYVSRSFGMVVIKADDGTRHRILHLETINPDFADGFHSLDNNPILIQGNSTGTGTIIGTMGDTAATGRVHVHYDIFLPDADGYTAAEPLDNRIDPLVYWTSGVNPTAGATGTGLYAFATPVTDWDKNGSIDSSGALSESSAFIRDSMRE